MKAVSEELLTTIKELQALSSLSYSSLGGGTNLAIRYGHRISVDIDLFFPSIIGKANYEEILAQVKEYFPGAITGADFPCDEGDQYMFLKFFVKKKNAFIKVEVLQNFQTHEEPEIVDGIRLMTENDIGMLKLMSASNRANDKDFYDLDYLTEVIPLSVLMANLAEKQHIYNKEIQRTIFDQDDEKSPVQHPLLLVAFEYPADQSLARPAHSENHIDIIKEQKSWPVARSNWKRKVREYFREIGVDYPSLRSLN